MSDTVGKPKNVPFNADTTMIQRDTKRNSVRYNFEDYMLGEFTQFMPRGSVRIGTSGLKVPPNPFRAPDQTIRLIPVNPVARDRMIVVVDGEKSTPSN